MDGEDSYDGEDTYDEEDSYDGEDTDDEEDIYDAEDCFSSEFRNYVCDQKLICHYLHNFSPLLPFCHRLLFSHDPQADGVDSTDYDLTKELGKLLTWLGESFPSVYTECLVQFWKAEELSGVDNLGEKRFSLTTRNQPFVYYSKSKQNQICSYRMRMNNIVTGDEGGGGVIGRIYRTKRLEFTPNISYYSSEEYPHRDLALCCGIKSSLSMPIFDSSRRLVGVLEGLFRYQDDLLILYDVISKLKIEPIPSGNLPPGFDPSTCRSVFVGNVHTQVTEILLQEVFASTGPVESCKLIRKEKSSYGFIHYFDRRSAALAILSLNGRQLFGQPIKVNWAYANTHREDTSSHFNVFVGDLSSEVTDAMLFACFSVYPSCSDARVMWDQKTGRSRGFGFVSFRNQQDAQNAINDLTGKWLGSRQIRCNWATKGAGTSEDGQSSEAKNVVELTKGSSDDGKDAINSEAPENNPQYTTVYVGNVAPELTQVDLHRFFHALGVGVIEEVRIQRDKGFGFVRYSTHSEAALAIQMGNTNSLLFGRQIKCSWGNKPTPPGTTSNPLPPPAAPPLGGLTPADLVAYQRELAMSKMGGVHALMHPQGQPHLNKQAPMNMGPGGASQALYDGGFQNVAATQQYMYYQ